MRKLLITDEIMRIAIKFRTDLMAGNHYGGTRLLIKPLKRLKTLSKKFESGEVTAENADGTFRAMADAENGCYMAYVDKVIADYKNIITILPNQIDGKNSDMMALLGDNGNERLRQKLKVGNQNKKSFADLIVNAMMYEETRRWILPQYIRQLGLKTCVYCNANFCITDEDENTYYDLDHWRPKSLYPWACTSFFNLQPVCSVCNRNKGNDEDLRYFGLYESDKREERDVLHFTFPKSDVAEFILWHKHDCINVCLEAYDAANDGISEHMNDKLHIDSLYKEHKDVVEETIWRKWVSNDSWRKSINEGLGEHGLRLTTEEVDRLIYGTYMRHEDIHKRPLTRLIQDVMESEL